MLIGPGIVQQLPLHVPAVDFGIAEPGQVVQAVALDIQRAVGDLQNLLQLLDEAAGGVADSVHVVEPFGPQGLGDDPAGIGKVENQMAGVGHLPGQGAVVHQGGHGPDGHGEASGTRGLLSQYAVGQAGLLIKQPPGVPAGPDGGDDVVHSRQGGPGVGGDLKGQVRVQPTGQLPGDLPVSLQLLLVVVKQDNVVHPDVPGALHERFGQKRGAGTGPADHTQFHE